eukprot:TRINITY_DN4259_c0_g1_i6.p1 TRINITY_DN4259_c0_g1~~TRINITY_DN4259_c0_g1_i6.p1  ORF type:complete len:935 (-),score=162.04 TRINITY_DN4259_c0_g1_i6:117-2921(-)
MKSSLQNFKRYRRIRKHAAKEAVDQSSQLPQLHQSTSPFTIQHFAVVGLPLHDATATAAFQLHDLNPAPASLARASFKAQIVDRLPKPFTENEARREKKHPTRVPFPAGMEEFCFPEGVALVVDTELPVGDDAWRFFTFSLTTETGARLYCSSVVFFEQVPEPVLALMQSRLPPEAMSQSNALAAGENFYAPKALCLLSLDPYFSFPGHFLHQMLRMLFQPTRRGTTLLVSRSDGSLERALSAVPAIELILMRMLCEVQTTIASPVIRVHLTENVIIALDRRRKHSDLPILDVPLRLVVACLPNLSMLMLLFAHVLLESRILVFSSRIGLLTPFIEGLICLLFPFRCSVPCVPVLPTAHLAAFLAAPFPFIIGVSEAALALEQVAEAIAETPTVLVNLDSGAVIASGVPTPPLPQGPQEKLFTALQQILQGWIAHHTSTTKPGAHIDDSVKTMLVYASADQSMCSQVHDSSWGIRDIPQNTIEFPVVEVRQTFLRFFSAIFLDYKPYLVFPSPAVPEPESTFDREGFISNSPGETRAFLRLFLDTQMFTTFCDERVYHAASNAELIREIELFDNAISSKIQRSKLGRIASQLASPQLQMQQILSPVMQSATLAPPNSSHVSRRLSIGSLSSIDFQSAAPPVEIPDFDIPQPLSRTLQKMEIKVPILRFPPLSPIYYVPISEVDQVASAVVKIQAWCRMLVASRRFRKQRAQIVLLQALWRARRQRRQYQATREILVRLQAHERRRQARKQYLHKRQQLVQVQALQRARRQRRRYLAHLVKITVVQSLIRRFLSRLMLRRAAAAAVVGRCGELVAIWTPAAVPFADRARFVAPFCLTDPRTAPKSSLPALTMFRSDKALAFLVATRQYLAKFAAPVLGPKQQKEAARALAQQVQPSFLAGWRVTRVKQYTGKHRGRVSAQAARGKARGVVQAIWD